MKDLSEDQWRLLESLNGLSHISSKEAKSLLQFAKDNIDPNITCCTTCADQVRRLVRRISNWWELNRKIDMIWDIDEADIQALEAQEVPNDILVCGHCQKQVKRTYYERFHGEKCKMNPANE